MKKKKIHLSDLQVVKAIQSGDKLDESIWYLYDRYYEELELFLFKNGGTKQDAEDVFQEGITRFIKVVLSGKFRFEATIKTYLFTAWVNHWGYLNKKRGKDKERDENYYYGNLQSSKTVLKDIEESEREELTLKFFDNIGDKCKDVLYAFYYQGLSYKEMISRFPGYSDEQVLRNKKHACIKKLKSLVKENNKAKNWLKKLLLKTV